MTSKDLQNIVLSKYQNGDTPTEIYRDLNIGISLATIKRWCQMIRQSGSIQLRTPPGCPRLARTKQNIQKGKKRLRRKKRISTRKLSMELDISERSVRRI
jgi:transposase